MRWTLLILVLTLAGCKSTTVGPFEHRPPERVDDPLLSTTQQERVGRARLALPDESWKVGPPSGVYLPTSR